MRDDLGTEVRYFQFQGDTIQARYPSMLAPSPLANLLAGLCGGAPLSIIKEYTDQQDPPD